MVFAGIECHGSTYKCTWLIPQSIVDKLKANLPVTIFKEHSLSKLTIAGAGVYSSQQVELAAFAFIYLFNDRVGHSSKM